MVTIELKNKEHGFVISLETLDPGESRTLVFYDNGVVTRVEQLPWPDKVETIRNGLTIIITYEDGAVYEVETTPEGGQKMTRII